MGIPVSAAVAARIAALRDEFGGGAVRWTPAENLHVTLKFLGDVDEDRVGSMRAALRDALSGVSGFCAAVKGLGVFPDARRPRVLWAGLAAADMVRTARLVERALEPLGVEPETERFRPHVTIGRWWRPEPGSAGLREELARWRDREFGEFRIDAVTLFHSTLRPAGAVYDPLEVFPLDGARESLPPARRDRV